MSIFGSMMGFINPSKNPDIDSVFKYQSDHLPTLWLLGKTGAGKSSFIRAVINDSGVEIGNGFRPCTSTSRSYNFPTENPLMRFLDTRGLAEVNYNADEDIEACQGCSNALIIVMKAEDPEQSSVINALKKIKKYGIIKHILLVHSGVFLIENTHDRQCCIAHNQGQIDNIWDTPVDSVDVDFELDNGACYGVEELKSNLANFLPVLAQLNMDEDYTNAEEKNYYELKTEALWYSGAAGASDAIPVIGLVSVPLIQGKMLHSFANQYGIEWNKKAMSEFIGVLGTGFGIQYATKLGLRQLVKLIPIYGQTIGAASTAVISFCTTYAIARVACKYMYHKSNGESVSKKELKETYRSAFSSIKEVTKSETNRK